MISTTVAGSTGGHPTRLLIIVVLYKRPPVSSATVRSLLSDTLLRGEAVSPSSLPPILLLWDNTPGGQDAGPLPPGIRYVAAPGNPGLAEAYNFAIELAAAEGCGWLMTLDQDSEPKAGFVESIRFLIDRYSPSPEIAAILPTVTSDGRVISPYRLAGGVVPRWYAPGFTGVPTCATYAVNSASTLRIAALQEVGGYDPLFHLDFSDIHVFQRLWLAGKRVFVAGDVEVRHELALLDKGSRMSLERYRTGLLDECAFYDLYMTFPARMERAVRLLGRSCKDALRSELHPFLRISTAELVRRLFVTRSRRLARWKTMAQARLERHGG